MLTKPARTSTTIYPLFQYFSDSQSVSAFTGKEIDAVNQLREGKYIQKEWIYSR